LLTNDGDLTFRLTHPRHSVSKTYQVWVQGQPAATVLTAWRRGIDLEGQYTLPAKVTVLKHQTDRTLLEVVLTEGRNRQIRRVATQLGCPVLYLHRTRIGDINIDSDRSLPLGSYRHLQLSELHRLEFAGDRSIVAVPISGQAPI
jgi:23S rRNA pseudouridine2605 synthase